MAKKPALGKGIDALMGTGIVMPGRDSTSELRSDYGNEAAWEERGTSQAKSLTGVTEVEIDLVDVNPFQPRSEFHEGELEDLADSIKKLGIIQPLTLRKIGERFQLISGERRLRASKLAGLTHVPAYVRTADDQGMIEMALVENIQRSDLNAVEIALSFQRLIQECNLSQEDLAPRVGKNRATISNYLRLLRLPHEVQYAIRQGLLSMGHARALLPLESSEQQLLLMQRIIEENLSVRTVEELVKKQTNPSAASAIEEGKTSPEALPHGEEYVQDMQARLEALLGWGVQVKPGSHGKGRVVISYRSEGERLELMHRLGLDNN